MLLGRDMIIFHPILDLIISFCKENNTESCILKNGVIMFNVRIRSSNKQVIVIMNNKPLLTLVFFFLIITCKVKSEHQKRLSSILRDYEQVQRDRSLLWVEFQSLSEYLHLLQMCSTCLQGLGKSAMLYLAAAVADFYIPKDQMVTMVFDNAFF